jgi:hypothetical protein
MQITTNGVKHVCTQRLQWASFQSHQLLLSRSKHCYDSSNPILLLTYEFILRQCRLVFSRKCSGNAVFLLLSVMFEKPCHRSVFIVVCNIEFYERITLYLLILMWMTFGLLCFLMALEFELRASYSLGSCHSATWAKPPSPQLLSLKKGILKYLSLNFFRLEYILRL